MIVCLVSSFELLLRLTRIDSLKNRKSSEILESELKLADSLRTGKVLRLFSLLSLFDLLRHSIAKLRI